MTLWDCAMSEPCLLRLRYGCCGVVKRLTVLFT